MNDLCFDAWRSDSFMQREDPMPFPDAPKQSSKLCSFVGNPHSDPSFVFRELSISKIRSMFLRSIILLAIITHICLANTSSTAELGEVRNVGSMVLLYRNQRGELPHTWGDLLNLDLTRGVIREIEKSQGSDFLKNFRFVDRGETLLLADPTKRILAMSTSTRRMVDTEIGYRFMIVVDTNGDLSVPAMSEGDLRRYLKRHEVNLDDYTGPYGKWEPEPGVPEINYNSVDETHPENGEAVKLLPQTNSAPPQPSLIKENPSQNEERKSVAIQVQWVWGIVIFVFLVLGAFLGRRLWKKHADRVNLSSPSPD